MKINKNGGWEPGPGHIGHAYIEPMAKIIKELVVATKPSLVYDFGCGFGHYIRDVSDLGVDAIGFEQFPNTSVYKNIQEFDLSQERLLEKKSDLTICLEVGEHIPKKYESIVLDNICNNTGNILLLSWAIVGQDGFGHVNCQNNDYIISEVEKRGFRFVPKIIEARNSIKDLMWFHNTLMLFHRV